MRTLELRLEDVGYHFEHEGWKVQVHIDGAPMPSDEAARKFAALAFFDRALISYAIDRKPAGAFEDAAALTLLRFGVRILGLEVGAELEANAIVYAVRDLYDNRLGWGAGRNPYAPRELWARLGEALYGADAISVVELREDAPGATISPDPPQPTDPEPIASLGGGGWPLRLIWGDEGGQERALYCPEVTRKEIDRRWSEEPKLRERIEQCLSYMERNGIAYQSEIKLILRGEQQ